MIAHDDVIVTFHKENVTFNLKIACRRGRKVAQEIVELLGKVVDNGTTLSYAIERSRFAPEQKRERERVTTAFAFPSDLAAVAASNIAQHANGNATPKRGRPRSTKESFSVVKG